MSELNPRSKTRKVRVLAASFSWVAGISSSDWADCDANDLILMRRNKPKEPLSSSSLLPQRAAADADTPALLWSALNSSSNQGKSN